MEIKRVVNGIEYTFQLTDREMRDAFYEQRDSFDMEDIRCEFDCEEDADLIERYGKTFAELEPLFGEMAYEMRKNMDKYDMEFPYARDEAIKDVLARHKTEF